MDDYCFGEINKKVNQQLNKSRDEVEALSKSLEEYVGLNQKLALIQGKQEACMEKRDFISFTNRLEDEYVQKTIFTDWRKELQADKHHDKVNI